MPRSEDAPRDASAVTILVVDDEPDALATLSALLTFEGFRVLGALSGPQALAMITERQPDLIICDVMMPEVSGFDVCSAVRASAHSRHIPIIILSGLPVRANPALYDRAFVKPAEHQVVVETVWSLLRKRR